MGEEQKAIELVEIQNRLRKKYKSEKDPVKLAAITVLMTPWLKAEDVFKCEEVKFAIEDLDVTVGELSAAIAEIKVELNIA